MYQLYHEVPRLATDANRLYQKLITSCLIGGVSGCGKTQLVQLMRSLLNLQEHEFIRIPTNQWGSVEQTEQLTGSPPGTTGYTDTSSGTVFQLLKAIGRPWLRSIDNQEETNDQKKVRELIKKEKEQQLNTLPRIIVLQFEEFSRAHHSLSAKLLDFMETGRLRSSSQVEFVLPDNVRLLILFTSNFGAEACLTLTADKYEIGVQQTVADMKASQIGDPFIGRLRKNIHVFLSIAEETIRTLLESDIAT